MRLSLQGFDNVWSLVSLAGIAAYLFPALRRTYGGGAVAVSLCALDLVLLLSPVLLL